MVTRRMFLGFQTAVPSGKPAKQVDQLNIGKSGTPTQFYMTAGAAPTSTTVDGFSYDAVQFLDAQDRKLKLLLKDGSVLVLGAVAEQA